MKSKFLNFHLVSFSKSSFSMQLCSFSIVILLFIAGCAMFTHNGLALGEEADFEALNCLPALNLIRSTKLHLSTELAFCQTPVIAISYLSVSLFHSCSMFVINNALSNITEPFGKISSFSKKLDFTF